MKKHIHFVGICGTAMASAAVMLKELGLYVTGSDENVYPPMSTFLADNQITVLKGYTADNLHPSPDLVVIGNALSRGNPEVEAVLEQHLHYVSLPELLRDYMIRGRKSIVVTGTHGKTTTTALVSWILESVGKSPGFMVGGIPLNFGTSARLPAGDIFVCEGDEYDTAFFDKRSKFLNYLPEFVIINNIEFDHADIFDSLPAIQKSFRQMVNIVPRSGLIVVNGDDANARAVVENAFCPVETFGFSMGCDWRVDGVSFSTEGTTFDVWYRDVHFSKMTIPLFGNHNLKNALAAIGLLYHFGLDAPDLQKGFAAFRGVKRRLELRGVVNEVFVYDDFAHHPTAISETLFAVRQKHPQQRIIAVFEPRSNTSVRHFFQDRLPTAFKDADVVILHELHRKDKISPANRLQPEKVIKALQEKEKMAFFLPDVTAILDQLKEIVQAGDVVVVMSNGGFGGIHQKLLGQL